MNQDLSRVAILAARILKKLACYEIAYAVAPDRGENRGFPALHDLFDANEMLPRPLNGNFSDPKWLELAKAVTGEVTKLLLAHPIAQDDPLCWIECTCGEHWCTIHGEHTSGCDCVEIEALPFDPYQARRSEARKHLTVPGQ